MINNLLNEIKNRLLNCLGDALPSDIENHIKIDSISNIAKKDIPLIEIFPANVNIHKKDRATEKIEEGIKKNRTEFARQLSIKIVDETITNLEKLSSLVNAIIVVDKKEIIESANSADLKYISGDYKTEHFIETIELIDGIFEKDGDLFIYKMNMIVNGYIDMTKTITEGFEKISEVIIDTNL